MAITSTTLDVIHLIEGLDQEVEVDPLIVAEKGIDVIVVGMIEITITEVVVDVILVVRDILEMVAIIGNDPGKDLLVVLEIEIEKGID